MLAPSVAASKQFDYADLERLSDAWVRLGEIAGHPDAVVSEAPWRLRRSYELLADRRHDEIDHLIAQTISAGRALVGTDLPPGADDLVSVTIGKPWHGPSLEVALRPHAPPIDYRFQFVPEDPAEARRRSIAERRAREDWIARTEPLPPELEWLNSRVTPEQKEATRRVDVFLAWIENGERRRRLEDVLAVARLGAAWARLRDLDRAVQVLHRSNLNALFGGRQMPDTPAAVAARNLFESLIAIVRLAPIDLDGLRDPIARAGRAVRRLVHQVRDAVAVDVVLFDQLQDHAHPLGLRILVNERTDGILADRRPAPRREPRADDRAGTRVVDRLFAVPRELQALRAQLDDALFEPTAAPVQVVPTDPVSKTLDEIKDGIQSLGEQLPQVSSETASDQAGNGAEATTSRLPGDLTDEEHARVGAAIRGILARFLALHESQRAQPKRAWLVGELERDPTVPCCRGWSNHVDTFWRHFAGRGATPDGRFPSKWPDEFKIWTTEIHGSGDSAGR